MVSVPYVLLGVVGFLVYRGVKKNAEYRRACGESALDPSQPEPPTDV
jgi:hypothetical protein